MKNKQEFEPLESPLNAQERFQHATIVRLEALIESVNSIVEHLAKQDSVAVTEIKVETVLPVKEKVKPVEEIKVEAPVRKSTKRK